MLLLHRAALCRCLLLLLLLLLLLDAAQRHLRQWVKLARLTAETIQSAALPLQRVDDVHGGDSFALSVFGVGDGIANNVLKENLEHAARLFVDEAGDTFYATATSETTNSGLGDALDVITKNFAMTLGATFSQPFATLAATGHCVVSVET
ncbi:MAG TPA: hypothetical protein VGL07_06450 [Buttiauxella sp.]